MPCSERGYGRPVVERPYGARSLLYRYIRVYFYRVGEFADRNKKLGYTVLIDRSSFPEECLALRKDILQASANRIPEKANWALDDITDQLPTGSKLSDPFSLSRSCGFFWPQHEMPEKTGTVY
jgi:hypothetical protein